MPSHRGDNLSDANETLNQPNAKTDKAGNDEHEQKRRTGDSRGKRRHPTNGSSNERGYLSKDISHIVPPVLDAGKALNKANTDADKADDNERENERIRRNCTSERRNPLDALSDKRSHIGKNGGDSHSSFLKNHPFERILCNMGYISDNPNYNDEKSEADKIANRLRHEERGELRQKPCHKGLHISHESAHPPNGTGSKSAGAAAQHRQAIHNPAAHWSHTSYSYWSSDTDEQ